MVVGPRMKENEMATYASQTTVAADKTRGEIERTLQRYGATSFAYGWDGDRAMIGFAAHDRQIRFTLTMPDRNLREFTHTPSGKQARHPDDAHRAWEQACRSSWRALLLVIKAKLEAVEAGISVFEDEFLAQIVLPDGSTVSDFIQPQIAETYATGLMPAMLPALGAGA